MIAQMYNVNDQTAFLLMMILITIQMYTTIHQRCESNFVIINN